MGELSNTTINGVSYDFKDAGAARQSHSHTKSQITDFPTLGTAASKNVPSSGNASTSQVVMGNDSRLSDARTPTSHTHTKSQITDFPTLGTASAKDVPTSGNASISQVVMGNDSRLSDARTPTSHTHTKSQITDFPTSMPASDVYSWAKASSKPSYTASEVGAIATTAKGAASGVAELDANGKVPSSQLPSYVDDVLEYSAKSSFPSTGETGKIYVDTSTNKTYRWSGSAYVEISASLALGETSSTAYYGDKGKTAYTHSQTTSGNPHNVTKSDVGLGNVGNFKAVSTVASQGLTDTEKSNARTNIGAGTSSFNGSYNALSDKPSTFPPSSHTHSSIESKTVYSFDATTKPQSFDLGISAGFVNSNAGYGSYGDVLTVRAYSSGGGSLQLYAPYSPSLGGTHLKARFGNYDVDQGNSWTELKDIAWVSDIPTSLPASDVYSWAKASTKPSYTYSEVGAAASSHTHNYAGSSSAGGVATSAAKLSNTSKIGDTNKPVYFKADGTPAAISYTIDKSVPSNAVFTDTTYSAATQSAAGLMSASDKTKLDGIASGAQVNSITGVKGNSESSYRTGNVNLTAANVGAAASSHTHGNIQNGGTLQTNDIAIASGDKLVVTDYSDSNKVARTSISFDGSTATQALTKKGTWETFNNYSHPTGNGNNHVPSGGSAGQILAYGGNSANEGKAIWVSPGNTLFKSYTETINSETDTMLPTSYAVRTFFKSVINLVHSFWGDSTSYTMWDGDFVRYNSQGLYIITIINWAVSPDISIHAVAYSGNSTSQAKITKIAGIDRDITLSGNTININSLSSAKVTIYAVQ